MGKYGVEERQFSLVSVVFGCKGNGDREAECEEGGENHLKEWDERRSGRFLRG